jgi:hypothetical protein
MTQTSIDTGPRAIASLADLCVASAASGHTWTKQWRSLHVSTGAHGRLHRRRNPASARVAVSDRSR